MAPQDAASLFLSYISFQFLKYLFLLILVNQGKSLET